MSPFYNLTTHILDGRALAGSLKCALKIQAQALETKLGRKPSLAIIRVGEDPGSVIYVGRKQEQAQSAGIDSILKVFPVGVSMAEVRECIEAFNKDDTVDGILLQLPLPDGLDKAFLIDCIDPRKDVDGLTSTNQGLLFRGTPNLVPCTPKGCVKLLEQVLPSLAGLHAVIIGRSWVVGRPMASLLTAYDMTVTLAHSHTITNAHSHIRTLEALTREADVVISATGTPNLIGAKHIREGAVVLDVGITRRADGTITGDVNFEEVRPKALAITPVPGGVGPMTVVSLLQNTVLAAGKSIHP